MTRTRKPAPLQVVAQRLGLPLGRLLRARDDVQRNTWQSGAALVLLYVLLAAALGRMLPVWVLFVCVPPLYVRAALGVHELMHARSERQVPWLHRLMLVFESPLSLGYREHRDIHVRHHRYCVTERDPELYQITGGHLRALGAAMLSPELGLVGYIRHCGISRALAGEAAIRGTAFVAVSLVYPAAFLAYWFALRVSIGLSSYAFHHVLHHRGGEYGTFALELSTPLERLLGIVIGRECVHILTEHPAHHAWQGVKAEELPTVAPALPGGPQEPVGTAALAGHTSARP